MYLYVRPYAAIINYDGNLDYTAIFLYVYALRTVHRNTCVEKCVVTIIYKYTV